MRYRGLSASAALLFPVLSASCGQFGYVRVDEAVYISKPLPALERAAKEMSTARNESRAGEASGRKLAELSVTVSSQAGLGPEEFRIIAGEGEIRVEGGGAAGALYGGLEAAERMRLGLEGPSLALGRSSPRFPRRIIRSALRLPGLSPRPSGIDWDAFLDKLALARFNTLAVSCGHAFPGLVRLTRFPKAFQGIPVDGTSSRELEKVLSLAETRGVRLIVTPVDLAVPEYFFRSYGSRAGERSAGSALGRSYLKECIAELLRAYPLIAGVGLGEESLRSLPDGSIEEFTRSVFLEGIRSSGRKAFLFIHGTAAARLARLALPADVEVLRERELPSSILAAAADERGSERTLPSATTGVCGSLPRRLLFPFPASPARCGLISRQAAAAARGAFLLDAFDTPVEAGRSAYLFRREAFLAASIGLSAHEPELLEDRWKAMWDDLGGRALIDAAGALGDAWAELGLLHGESPGWSPLSSRELASDPARGGLRDGAPFVSLIELIFTRSADPRYLSIPELIVSEVRGQPLPAPSRSPLDLAAILIEKAESCLGVLESLRKAGGADASAGQALLARELEGHAHLAAFHARRIRAGVFLLRHVAGLGSAPRDAARKEIAEAARRWSLAERAFAALRTEDPAGDVFPDLAASRPAVAEDSRTVEEARSDPLGLRASPLLESPIPLPRGFDFGSLRGFLHVGTGILDNPPAILSDDGQVFEAEDFTGSWSRRKDIPGTSGTACVSSEVSGRAAGSGMTLRIGVEKAGVFHAWTRGLIGAGDAGSFRLRIGGTLLRPTHEARAGERRLAWERAGQVDLSAGETFLQVLDAGIGKEGVDCVVLTRDARWIPPTF